jgi:hypothetical protein
MMHACARRCIAALSHVCAQRLLLEGAVFGAVLFGVEQRLEQQFSYPLSSRRDREEQAEQPPL